MKDVLVDDFFPSFKKHGLLDLNAFLVRCSYVYTGYVWSFLSCYGFNINQMVRSLVFFYYSCLFFSFKIVFFPIFSLLFFILSSQHLQWC